MQFLHMTFRYEFTNEIEEILEERGIGDFVRYPMVEGQDRDGRHFGSKAFPGSMTVVQAFIPDEEVNGLLEDIQAFREKKESHRHLRALIMPVSETIGI